MNLYLNTLKKAFDYSGRASRSEYWLFSLANTLLMMVIQGLAFVDMGTAQEAYLVAAVVMSFGLALPAMAVTVRRLHDVGKNGWTLLLAIIPVFGPLYIFYLQIKPGQAGTNRYGLNPLEAAAKDLSFA